MIRYNVRPLAENESVRWDVFVASHPFGYAVATTCAKKWWEGIGWSFQPMALFENDSIVGGITMHSIKVPYLPRTLVRAAALLLTNGDIITKTRNLLDTVTRFAHSQKALQIEVRSGIIDIHTQDQPCHIGQVQQALCESGYAPSDKREGTYLVRIDRDDEDLLNSFSSKCRRDIRKAQRQGVTVTELRSPEDIQTFGEFHQQMISRKKLRNLRRISESAYEGLQPLYEQGYVRLFAAQYEGKICNMALIDAIGVPAYFIGATSPHAFYKGMPPTGQILHYNIMRWFRERGVKYYDLGGSPGPEPIREHPNYAVWRFKHEFGGAYIYTMPSYRFSPTLAGKVLTSVARRLSIIS